MITSIVIDEQRGWVQVPPPLPYTSPMRSDEIEPPTMAQIALYVHRLAEAFGRITNARNLASAGALDL